MKKHHYTTDIDAEHAGHLFGVSVHVTYSIQQYEQDCTREHPGQLVDEVEVELCEPFLISSAEKCYSRSRFVEFAHDYKATVDDAFADELDELRSDCEEGKLRDTLIERARG